MGRKVLLVGLFIVSLCGVPAVAASAASTPEPTIKSFSPSSGTPGTEVTITGTNLADATKVTFNGEKAKVISKAATKIVADAPAGATTGKIKVKTAGGTSTSVSEFTVVTPLGNIISAASDGSSYCALSTTGEVDCWGNGEVGELGNGTFYTSSPHGSATPVAVGGGGGVGTLTGVTSLVGDGSGFCALLTSSGVDCWGNGEDGGLGNGIIYTSSPHGSATPVAVVGVGGVGTLTGVADLVDQGLGYCALLTSGGINCWGWNSTGQMGNGTFNDSATPVAVIGIGGVGTLTGVTDLVSEGLGDCALFNSGEAACWGSGSFGQLGNGTLDTSATPVAVVGVGGSGILTGVTSLVSDSDGYCTLLTSSAVDCWGYGPWGQLGNGTSPQGSDVPVGVVGVGGTGMLAGVTKLFSDGSGYCAVLTSGQVVCWGDDRYGELANGSFVDSDTPVAVEGVGGVGTLTGVTSITSDQEASYCALLTSGGTDCWGYGDVGELGNGTFYTSKP